MLRDPVCGMEVSADSRWFTSYQGETYYFCAKGCKEEFDQSPEHFASRLVSDRGEMTEDTYPTTGTEADSVDRD
jgi:YHS domain-containing protein